MNDLDTNPEVLSDFHSWLLKVAWEYASTPEDAQDLAQEGRIAMWQALTSWRGEVKLSTHLMNKARWKMAEVCARGNFTGKPSQRGKKYVNTASNRARETATDFASSDLDVEGISRDQAESASIVYHRDEILEAVRSLKPSSREKVFDWFWRGVVDSKNRSWWDSFPYGAKYKLREKLGHLRELI